MPFPNFRQKKFSPNLSSPSDSDPNNNEANATIVQPLVDLEASDSNREADTRPTPERFPHSLCQYGVVLYILGIGLCISVPFCKLPLTVLATDLLPWFASIIGFLTLAISALYLVLSAILGRTENRPKPLLSILLAAYSWSVFAVLMSSAPKHYFDPIFSRAIVGFFDSLIEFLSRTILSPSQTGYYIQFESPHMLECGLLLFLLNITGLLLMLRAGSLRWWVIWAAVFVLSAPLVLLFGPPAVTLARLLF